MKAPHKIETRRLILRKPLPEDAGEIFSRYAGDEEVTRYLGWPQHTSLGDTHQFLQFSENEWAQWPAGPYLVESRENHRIIGSTGLAFETPMRASTGYVLAKDSWGQGYASESVHAIIQVARQLGVVRLYALCHTSNAPSWRVLEKCGFSREGLLRSYCEFPNLLPPGFCDVFCYAIILREPIPIGPPESSLP